MFSSGNYPPPPPGDGCRRSKLILILKSTLPKQGGLLQMTTSEDSTNTWRVWWSGKGEKRGASSTSIQHKTSTGPGQYNTIQYKTMQSTRSIQHNTTRYSIQDKTVDYNTNAVHSCLQHPCRCFIMRLYSNRSIDMCVMIIVCQNGGQLHALFFYLLVVVSKRREPSNGVGARGLSVVCLLYTSPSPRD